MLTQWYPAVPYPTDALPERIGSFVRAVAVAAQASEALVGPVVLAAAAAAVQGVADVQTPFGTIMPTSIFVLVIARSGDGKSTVLRHVCKKFEAFEMQAPSHLNFEDNYCEHGAHPFILEEATEAGVIDLYRQGAQSLFYALDEGALLLRGRFDVPALCKRFDGTAIRRTSRKDGSIMLMDKRASLCLLTQDVTLRRYMNKNGPYLIESGFLPRVLVSAASTQPENFRAYGDGLVRTDTSNHEFHQRVKVLMEDYKKHLQGKFMQREKMILGRDAENLWNRFGQEIKNLLLSNSELDDIRAFLSRSTEHVLRVAAVMQWFVAPQPVIEAWALDGAVKIVKWHLGEAIVSFGQSSEEMESSQFSVLLLDYMRRKSVQTGKSSFARSEILRCAPKALRKADQLDIAIQQLLQQGEIGIFIFKNKEYIAINTNFPDINNFHLRSGCAPLGRRAIYPFQKLIR